MIVVIDYGVGNLQSLRKAFTHCGVSVEVSEDAEAIAGARAVVLPGVGSFSAGMCGLSVRGLIPAVKRFAAEGKPMLGICLGAQLLLSRGYEFGTHEGLGIIPGEVVHFGVLPEKEKVPQVGWNSVYPPEGVSWVGSVFEPFLPSRRFEAYFVHSYVLAPAERQSVFGETVYGGRGFCSVVRKDRIYGCQFHPEKSGEAGLRLIRSFIESI